MRPCLPERRVTGGASSVRHSSVCAEQFAQAHVESTARVRPAWPAHARGNQTKWWLHNHASREGGRAGAPRSAPHGARHSTVRPHHAASEAYQTLEAPHLAPARRGRRGLSIPIEVHKRVAKEHVPGETPGRPRALMWGGARASSFCLSSFPNNLTLVSWLPTRALQGGRGG